MAINDLNISWVIFSTVQDLKTFSNDKTKIDDVIVTTVKLINCTAGNNKTSELEDGQRVITR